MQIMRHLAIAAPRTPIVGIVATCVLIQKYLHVAVLDVLASFNITVSDMQARLVHRYSARVMSDAQAHI